MATLTSKLSKDPVPGTATGVVTHAAASPGYRHPLDQLTPEEVRESVPPNTRPTPCHVTLVELILDVLSMHYRSWRYRWLSGLMP